MTTKAKRRPRRLYALLVLVVALLLMLLALSVPVAHPVRCKVGLAEGRQAMRADLIACVKGTTTR